MSASKLVRYSLVCGVSKGSKALLFKGLLFPPLFGRDETESSAPVIFQIHSQPSWGHKGLNWSYRQFWATSVAGCWTKPSQINSQIFLSVGSHTFMYRDLINLQMHWSLILAVGWTEMFSCVKKPPLRTSEPENRLYTYNLVSLPRKEKLLLWFNPKRDWTGQVYEIRVRPPLNIEMLLVLPENKLHTSKYPSCFLHSQWQ